MNANTEKKIAERIKNRYPTDERVSGSNYKALAYCGIAAIVYDAAMLLYKCLISNGNPLPELILLAVMAIIITAVKHSDKIVEKPAAAGRLLDTGTSAGARMKRLAMYLLESLLFLGGIFAADFITVKTGITPADSRILDRPRAAVIFFVIAFLFTFIAGEHKAKKYNAFQKQLDEDENCLDD